MDYALVFVVVLAYIGPINSHAFGVIDNYNSQGIYGFSHELGHIIGMEHDIYTNQKTGKGSTSGYNHGFVNKGLWRTVMAYSIECSDSGLECGPVPYFSNPSVSYLFL